MLFAVRYRTTFEGTTPTANPLATKVARIEATDSEDARRKIIARAQEHGLTIRIENVARSKAK